MTTEKSNNDSIALFYKEFFNSHSFPMEIKRMMGCNLDYISLPYDMGLYLNGRGEYRVKSTHRKQKSLSFNENLIKTKMGRIIMAEKVKEMVHQRKILAWNL